MHNLAKKIADCLKFKVEAMGIDNIEGQELAELGLWADIIKDLVCYDKDMRIIKAMDEAEKEDEDDDEDEDRKYYRGRRRDSRGRFMSNRGRRRGYEEPMYYTMTPDMMKAHDPEYWRDMDRMEGRMYYPGGGSGGVQSGGMGGGQSGSGMSGGSRNYGGESEGGRNYGGESGGRRNYEGEGGGGGNRNYGGESGGNRNYGGESGGGRNYGAENRSSSRSENARRGYEETKMMQDGSPEGKKKAMESLENYMKELGEDLTEMVKKMDSSEKAMLKQKLQVLNQKIQ